MTADGHASYDVRITAGKLPRPDSLGQFTSYVAWAATPDLKQWVRLGVARNGTSTVGPVELNKFLLVITAEADSRAREARGADGAARHLAQRLAPVVPHPSAVSRHLAVKSGCSSLALAVAAWRRAALWRQQPAHHMPGMAH